MPEQRHILITGVSRGLGRAMTGGFIQAGHLVAGCARSDEALHQLRQEFPQPHRFDDVDVCSDAAVGDWADSVLSEWGVPDVVVNNAALINRNANLWDVSRGGVLPCRRRKHQRNVSRPSSFRPANDSTRDRSNCQLQLDLGSLDFPRSGTLLRYEVGRRRIDTGHGR